MLHCLHVFKIEKTNHDQRIIFQDEGKSAQYKLRLSNFIVKCKYKSISDCYLHHLGQQF